MSFNNGFPAWPEKRADHIGQNGNDGEHYEAVKFDGGKPRLTLLDPAFQEDTARALAVGEERYGTGNWRKGLSYSRLLDASRRHLAAVERGEDLDPDTGLPHLAHAASNFQFLEFYRRTKRTELDDRHFKPRANESLPGLPAGEAPGEFRTEQTGKERLHLQPVQERTEVPTAQERQTEAEGADPLVTLQRRITAWADQVFPSRTPEGALHKMMVHELPELLNGGLDDPLEYADVLILLLDIASLRGIDAISAAHQKMAINEKRKWAVDPRTGLMSHTKEAE